MPPTSEQQDYAEHIKVDVTWSDTSDVPRQIMNFPLEMYSFAGESKLNIEDKAECVLTHIKPLFTSGGKEVDSKLHFVLRRATVDKKGISTMRYRTFHEKSDGTKIPIVNGDTTIRMTRSHCFRILSNGVRNDVMIKLEQIDKIGAEKVVSDHLTERDYNYEILSTNQCILKIGSSQLLVWEVIVNLWIKKPPEKGEYGISNRMRMYVDADDGKLVSIIGDIAKNLMAESIIADGEYSGRNQTIIVMNEKTSKIDDILIWDRQFSIPDLDIVVNDATSEYRYGPASLSPKRIPASSTRPKYDQGMIEIDCLNYTRIVFQYFYERHERTGYDNAHGYSIIETHFGKGCGICDDARWDTNSVKIADEGPDYYSFCTLDTIAHEWTHGVNSVEANLILEGDHGALCEAICDAFSYFIRKWYIKNGGPSTGPEWELGHNLPKKSPRNYVRNIMDPADNGAYRREVDSAQDGVIHGALKAVSKGLQPDHMDDYLEIPQSNWNEKTDYGGVHINSGILNKALYLMLTGGNFTMKDGTVINIGSSIEPEVLETLYYHVLVHDLDPTSSYEQFAQFLIDSVDSLYTGVKVTNINDFRNAWKDTITNAMFAVGIKKNMIGNPKVKPSKKVDWEKVEIKKD